MLKLDIDSARYDRMRQSVVIGAGRGRVIISLEALEEFYRKPLEPDEAVDGAIGAGMVIRLAANATPADDGMINITSSILNGRNWESEEYVD